MTLVAGTNTVKAYAVDLAGNISVINNVSFVSSNTFQLQLKFSAAQPLTTTGLNFSLQLSPNINGTIQVSSDMTGWTALTNFVGTNTVLNFRDQMATNSDRRFYRAMIPRHRENTCVERIALLEVIKVAARLTQARIDLARNFCRLY